MHDPQEVDGPKLLCVATVTGEAEARRVAQAAPHRANGVWIDVSGCFLSVALEAFSITTDTIRGLQKSRPQAWGDSLTMTPFFTLRGLQKRVGTTSP